LDLGANNNDDVGGHGLMEWLD